MGYITILPCCFGWINPFITPAVMYIQATGGTITTDGDYKIHTFTSDGAFNVTQIGLSPLNQVEYLVIAGGGGGGGSKIDGGGGGAGGFRTATGFSITVQSYAITVGAGGGLQTNGSNSIFSSITSIGGGRGGYNAPTQPELDGASGGSGGGGGGYVVPASGGSGTIGQGN